MAVRSLLALESPLSEPEDDPDKLESAPELPEADPDEDWLELESEEPLEPPGDSA